MTRVLVVKLRLCNRCCFVVPLSLLLFVSLLPKKDFFCSLDNGNATVGLIPVTYSMTSTTIMDDDTNATWSSIMVMGWGTMKKTTGCEVE